MISSKTAQILFAGWMVCGYVLLSAQLPFGLLVTSGESMEPTLEGCEVVVLDANPSVEEGDIVAFDSVWGSQVLHRVVDVTPAGFVMQGDNLEQVDVGVYDEGDIYGELVWASPSLC